MHIFPTPVTQRDWSLAEVHETLRLSPISHVGRLSRALAPISHETLRLKLKRITCEDRWLKHVVW